MSVRVLRPCFAIIQIGANSSSQNLRCKKKFSFFFIWIFSKLTHIKSTHNYHVSVCDQNGCCAECRLLVTPKFTDFGQNINYGVSKMGYCVTDRPHVFRSNQYISHIFRIIVKTPKINHTTLPCFLNTLKMTKYKQDQIRDNFNVTGTE